jgi:tyrosyl-tRNA synthetase
MTAYTSRLLRTLHARGYIHQCTDAPGLDALAAEAERTGRPLVAYVGFDATADSLHVGHLVSIMLLRRMQQAGHKPVVLMGGGTTRVGDPSGKDETRQLLDDARIEANIAAIGRTFRAVLRFDGDPGGDSDSDPSGAPGGAVLVNNADWLDGLAYIPFLRDIGRHFTINRMLTFDSVRLRLDREQPLSFLEFNYMILQAYDFLELSRRLGCVLQMGGSDQWGNIVNGVELIRRVDGREAFGLTTPLITTASGAKMGKTAAGAVWLNPDRLSPWDYWQYWRNTEDADVGRFLRLFTDLPDAEIDRLDGLQGAGINEAKKVLATEATALLHGRDAALEAEETARRTFEQGAAAAGLPTVAVPRDELGAGIPAYALLRRAGLAASNGEARRLIGQGGARVNDVRLDDPERRLGAADLTADGVIKLSAGKKRHALVRAA